MKRKAESPKRPAGACRGCDPEAPPAGAGVAVARDRVRRFPSARRLRRVERGAVRTTCRGDFQPLPLAGGGVKPPAQPAAQRRGAKRAGLRPSPARGARAGTPAGMPKQVERTACKTGTGRGAGKCAAGSTPAPARRRPGRHPPGGGPECTSAARRRRSVGLDPTVVSPAAKLENAPKAWLLGAKRRP